MIRTCLAALFCFVPAALAAPPPVASCSDLGPVRWSGDEGALLTGGLVRRAGERLEVQEPGRAAWSLPLVDARLVEAPLPDPAALAGRYAEGMGGHARGIRVKGRGVRAEVDAEGVLRGTWKGDSVAWAWAGDTIFGGRVPPRAPLARLLEVPQGEEHPFRRAARATPAAAWAAAVEAAERGLGEPGRCEAGGATGVRLGPWSLPVGEGRVVAARSAQEALVVGGEGGAWYLSVPAPRELARALAAELGVGEDVRWEDGDLLVSRTNDPGQRLPGEPLAAGARPPTAVLSLFGAPALGLLGRDPGPPPTGGAGGSLIERALATLRGRAGLSVPERDPALAVEARGLVLNHEGAASRGGWLPEEPPGEGETLAVSGPGADPLLTLERWLADPAARARLLHPGLVALGAATGPDGRAVARGRILRAGVKTGPRAWPPDGAEAVPLRGPALTVWIPAPARVVQGIRLTVLGPGGQLVRTEVRGPGEGTGADPRTESVLQVWFPDGVVPGASYQWRLAWYQGDGDGWLGGAFRAALVPREEALLLSPLLQRVLTAANRARGELRRDPLVATRGGAAAAWWVSQGGRGAEAARLAGAQVAWVCAPATEWAAWTTREGPLPARVDALLLDPARTRVGGSQAPDGGVCVLVAG